MIELLVTLRDDTLQADSYNREHDAAAMQVALDLLDIEDFAFAVRSIRWGNYPHLTPEETVSASLDGHANAKTLRRFRCEFRTRLASRNKLRKACP